MEIVFAFSLLSKEILDHVRRSWNESRYDYSAITERTPLRWPNNSRVAFWLVPNIEYYPPDMHSGLLDSSMPDIKPDVLNFSWKDYSLRVGLWRVMEAMDRYNVKGTVALNSVVCELYPNVIRECKKRGWEFMGHGICNAWSMADFNEEEERDVVRETVRTIAKHCGKTPRGWLGPALAESPNTPEILVENGIRYVCDWVNDDQPYSMKTKNGRSIISIPYSIEINDYSFFIRQALTPQEFYQVCVEQFDTLYREGKDNGRVMCLPIHPFLVGQPFRFGYFEKLLKYITTKDGVWVTTGSEIVDWYVRKYLRGKQQQKEKT